MPIAALVSGVLGGAIGIVPTMWVAFAGGVLACLWVVFSPLRNMRDLPTTLLPASETEDVAGETFPRAE